MKVIHFSPIFAAILVSLPLVSAQDLIGHPPIDLGTLGGTRSQATAVNQTGSAVGSSSLANGTSHAFVFQGGSLRDLGTLPGGRNSSAAAINLESSAVGTSDVATSTGGVVSHAFLYGNGLLRDMGTLGGSQSRGNGINLLNYAVGSSTTASDRANHAFFWDPYAEKMNDLGTLGGTDSTAFAINASGLVVGSSLTGQKDSTGVPVTHAAAWNIFTGQKADLGSLGGSFGQAYAVNNKGLIVGASALPTGRIIHAFVYASGFMTDLGTLGGTYSQANAVNETGVIVGFSNIAGNASSHAFVWSRRGGLIDLNTLLPAGSDWVLTSATGITKSGKIVGTGLLKGNSRGFEWTIEVNGREY